MFVQDKFAKQKTFKRKGVITSVEVPIDKIDKDVSTGLYNYKILKRSNKLELVKGNNSFVITDTVGINTEVEYSLLFTDEAMFFVIHSGVLYVKDEKGKIIGITNTGTIEKFRGDSKAIVWKNCQQMRSYCNQVVGSRFNLYTDGEKESYVNNLIFRVKSSFKYGMGQLFSFATLSLNTDIGLKKFEYTVKEEKVQRISSYYEEEKKYTKKIDTEKDSSKYIEEDSDDDDVDEYKEFEMYGYSVSDGEDSNLDDDV